MVLSNRAENKIFTYKYDIIIHICIKMEGIMSKTLYFLKININSETVFQLYKGAFDPCKIMDELYYKIENNVKIINKIEKKVENEIKITEEEIEFTGIERYDIDSKKILVGNVIKSGTLFTNNVNKKTGEIKIIPRDNDEIVKFCFYPEKEIVAFYSSNRFGYQKFKESFEMLINRCYEDEHFKVSLMNSGISLNNIKESLKKIKNIEELTISIIPPNPGRKLMKKLERDAESKLKSMESGRITEKSVIFRSNYDEGLDPEADEIDSAIYELTSIHTKLTLEESTKNGYVNVEAISKSGEIYNTDNTKLIKYRISKDIKDTSIKFGECCKGVIESILKQ